MSTIVTRAGKGSPLTNNEVDANFVNLNTDKIESITSVDGSVVISATGTTRDLSVGIAGSTATLISQVRNETGATLTKGTVVYISGAGGNKALVSKALANADSTSAQTYGVIQADISNNQNGYVVVVGSVSGLNTIAYPDGTQLYLSGTTAGTYTSTKPYAPIHLVYVGVVTYSHANQGTIQVKIQNGYEMDELHNVSAQSPSNGNTLVYNTSNSLWESTSTLSGSYTLSGGTANGVTYLNGSKVLTSGSALTFDGTNLGVGTSATTGKLNVLGGPVYWGFTSLDGFLSYSGGNPAIGSVAGKDLLVYANGVEGFRLTSTSLYTASGINVGIGTSNATNKLTIGGTESSVFFKNSGATTGYAATQIVNTGGSFYMGVTSSTGAFWQNTSGNYAATIGTATATNLTFATSDTVRATLDSAGNLGLGVTPSAWSSFKVLELTGGVHVGNYTGSNNAFFGANSYFDGSWRYKATANAARYQINGYDGSHAWYNAPSGTAGDAISFTQAMTLDASGNLFVGYTGYPSGFSSGKVVVKQSTANGYGVLSFASSGSTQCVHIGHDGTNGYIGTTYGSGSSFTPLVFQTSDLERMRIASNGSVGINNNNPSYPLDVNGSTRIDASTNSNAYGLLIQGNGTSQMLLSVQDSGTNYHQQVSFNYCKQAGMNYPLFEVIPYYNQPLLTWGGTLTSYAGAVNLNNPFSGYPITFSIGTSEKMRISSAGSVGIATNNPQRTLDVNGYVNLGVSVPTVSGGGYADIHLRTWAGAVNSPAKIQIVDNWFDCYSTYTDGYRWSNYSSDGVVRRLMTLDGLGNVGIGTPNPTSFGGGYKTIEVAGNTGSYILFKRTDATAGTGEVAFDTDAMYVSTKTNHPMIFRINDSEKARFNTSGYLGIGTNDPRVKLNIDAGVVAGVAELVNLHNQGTSNGYGSSLTFSGYLAPSAYPAWRYAGIKGVYDTTSPNVGGSGWGGKLSFFVNRGVAADGFEDVMTISGGGYVGIGTTNPQTKLHVANSSSGLLFAEDGSKAVIIGTNAAGTASQELFLRGFPLTFTGAGGAGATHMTLNGSGNLGIGTNDPSYLLHVKGGGLGVTSADGTVTSSLNYNSIGTVTNSDFVFNTNNTERMRLNAAGNLLFNTSDNGSRIHVRQYETVTGAIAITGTTWVGMDFFNSNPNSGARNWKLATTYNSFGMFELLSGSTSGGTDYVSCLSLYRGSSLALQGALPQTGTGITFPATQSASSNANTLDDYEEGTWTPTVVNQSGTRIDNATTIGQYTKIGNRIIFNMWLVGGTLSGASTSVFVTLPFPVINNSTGYGPVSIWPYSGFTYTGQIIPRTQPGTSTVLLQLTNSGSSSEVTNANFSGALNLMLGGEYIPE